MKAFHVIEHAAETKRTIEARKANKSGKTGKVGKIKFTARFMTAVLLAVTLGGAAMPTAEAAVVWPQTQILPSFSTPAPVLDLMDVTTEYRYEAEGPLMRHNTGHLDGNGWLAQTGIDVANQHMVYGPYATDIPAGDNTAVFSISVDNNSANNQVVATIDVRDHATGAILATRDLTRHDFTGTYAAQAFELPFVNPPGGHALEFRVFWPGTSYVKVFDVGTNPKGKEDEALLFTTLKGVVNKTQPRIYSYDNAVRGEDGKTNWLNSLGLGYTEVADNWTLLTKYRSEISGIVIYDEALPDTLNLATTIASQHNGIVAAPSLVAKLTAAPYLLPVIDDLRGDFATNLQVYQYMYNNLWPSVTHKLVVGLRPSLKGFLRDYATSVQAAVIWLNPQIPAEDAVLRQFLADMPYGSGIYMGWWPDEGAGVARVSEYGLSTVASDFASNLTVFGGTDRNVAVKPTPNKPALENKIYISFILSDGDNLQYLEHRFKKIWDSPNRGEVPLGWTVSPAMLDAMPGVLDYLYDTATPNDALISGPTGIGYTYPNLWGNQTFLDSYVALSNDYMKRAGLKVLTVWNFINGATNDNVGNSFAAHAPSLLGLTAQNAGGEIKVYGNKLPSQGLNATYCYSEATLISEINNAIAGWDGQSPRFVTIQANPWDVNYQNFVNAKNHFSANSNLVFVRTDNYFQLMRENLQLPLDPEAAVKLYEAESAFQHSVGRLEGNDWSANTAQDNPGFMLWGNYDNTLPAGPLTAMFRMKIDNASGPADQVVTLEVRDNDNGQLLALFDVYRNQFKKSGSYQNFSLSFTNPGGHALEIRANYKDKATIAIDKVTVVRNLGVYEAEGSVVGHAVGRAAGDGWQATPALDGMGHMIYGPYDTNVPVGNRKIDFRLKVDSNSGNNANVAAIDVWDAATGTVVVRADLTRQQFTQANQYQTFTLAFDQTAVNRRLEYRVYFYDEAAVTVDRVTIR